MNIIMNENLILRGTIIFTITIFVTFSLQNLATAYYPQEDPSLPLIQLQLVLRDADGNLVAYIEPTTLFIASVPLTHEFLDTKNGTLFTKDGKTYELIEYDTHLTFSGEVRQFATYQESYKRTAILIFRHDGYLAGAGDELFVYWKIIRALD